MQKISRWPVTIQKLPCITAVVGYHGKRYKPQKRIPKCALVASGAGKMARLLDGVIRLGLGSMLDSFD